MDLQHKQPVIEDILLKVCTIQICGWYRLYLLVTARVVPHSPGIIKFFRLNLLALQSCHYTGKGIWSDLNLSIS
jgi:hypothetical protein